jgi:acyl-CoA synthetase (AMP-forming)/AMP-acid ligase II
VNLTDPIDEAIARVPDRIAFIVGDESVTYAALGEAIEHASAALISNGVGAGDRVALVDAAGTLAIATVLACARIGAAAAPMSARATATEIAAMIGAAKCGPVAVAGEDAAARVTEATGAKPLGEEILTSGGHTGASRAPVRDEDVSIVLFTSGTTGVPKPVPLSHAVLGGRVRGFTAIDPSSVPTVSFVCVPFHHVAGLIGVLVGLAGGNTAVFQRRFDAGEWLTLVEQHRVQRVFLVPTMLQRIIDHPAFEDADLSTLQLITYGAAPASPELIARAVEAFPPSVAFVQVFGQTETLGAVTALGSEDHKTARASSVGKAMPGVEVRIVDSATGKDVPEGEAGEFWVRAQHTATTGWVRSGDLVRRDEDGYLYVIGRLSDVINRGGEKIDPAEVEAVLRAHDDIVDVAVRGVADAELGEDVAAAVVVRAPIDPEALRAWCRARLAGHKVPRRIVFTDELPLTELGKVSRRDLRAMLEADH